MKKQPIIIKEQERTLLLAMEDYIENCNVKGLTEETIRNYTQTITYFIGCIGNKSVHEVTQKDLDKYVLFMRNKSNTNTTIGIRLKMLKPFLKYLTIDLEFPSISRDTKKKKPYTKEELQTLLAPPKKPTYTQWRNWAIANFFYGTACRVGSLINVKIKDVNFTNNTVYFSKVKNNKPYYVPLSSELKTVLKKYLSLYTHTDDDYLFVSLYGEQLNRQTLKQSMREYHLSRGILVTGLHRYRHTFAHDYLKSGGNLMYLKELMNHSDIKITQQYLNISIHDLQHQFDDLCPLDNMKRKGIKITNPKKR